jgi:hypothetical protein
MTTVPELFLRIRPFLALPEVPHSIEKLGVLFVENSA